jgi:chromate transport protein ChrA
MNELVFVLTPVLLAFLLGYLSVKVNKELAPLQFLFLFMAMFFMVIASSTQVTLSNVANGTATWNDVYTISQTNLTLSIWGTIITIAIFLVMFLYWIFRNADPRSKYPFGDNKE